MDGARIFRSVYEKGFGHSIELRPLGNVPRGLSEYRCRRQCRRDEEVRGKRMVGERLRFVGHARVFLAYFRDSGAHGFQFGRAYRTLGNMETAILLRFSETRGKEFPVEYRTFPEFRRGYDLRMRGVEVQPHEPGGREKDGGHAESESERNAERMPCGGRSRGDVGERGERRGGTGCPSAGFRMLRKQRFEGFHRERERREEPDDPKEGFARFEELEIRRDSEYGLDRQYVRDGRYRGDGDSRTVLSPSEPVFPMFRKHSSSSGGNAEPYEKIRRFHDGGENERQDERFQKEGRFSERSEKNREREERFRVRGVQRSLGKEQSDDGDRGESSRDGRRDSLEVAYRPCSGRKKEYGPKDPERNFGFLRVRPCGKSRDREGGGKKNVGKDIEHSRFRLVVPVTPVPSVPVIVMVVVIVVTAMVVVMVIMIVVPPVPVVVVTAMVVVVFVDARFLHSFRDGGDGANDRRGNDVREERPVDSEKDSRNHYRLHMGREVGERFGERKERHERGRFLKQGERGIRREHVGFRHESERARDDERRSEKRDHAGFERPDDRVGRRLDMERAVYRTEDVEDGDEVCGRSDEEFRDPRGKHLRRIRRLVSGAEEGLEDDVDAYSDHRSVKGGIRLGASEERENPEEDQRDERNDDVGVRESEGRADGREEFEHARRLPKVRTLRRPQRRYCRTGGGYRLRRRVMRRGF